MAYDAGPRGACRGRREERLLSDAARIVVVGAGPAGVRAAQALVESGVRPVLVEEGERDGGQIYRRQPEGFRRSGVELYGSDAAKAAALHRAFDALRTRIDYRGGTLAWNLTPHALHVVRGTAADTIDFEAILVWAGATDRVAPVPGWQHAGCYSLGAAQIALKAQACAVGARVAFLGSGPLLYLVANQYLRAGATVAAVLDTASPAIRWRALVGLLARPALVRRGWAMLRALRRARVPLLRGVSPVAIEGEGTQGVTAVSARDARGQVQRFEADAVALGWHLRPEAQLADLAGCDFAFDSASRQWLPRADPDGRSSVHGVYLAGDGARILGADGAETTGRLAALAALADLGHAAGSALYAREGPRLRRALVGMERFRIGIASAFPWPREYVTALADDAVVCRCEVVTAGELRRAIRECGSREVNRAKAFSRVGMGRCQGRYCGHAAAEIVAAAAGVEIDSASRLRTQAPVKPLTMNLREASA